MKPFGLRPFAWDFAHRKCRVSQASVRRTRHGRFAWRETFEDRIVNPRRGTERVATAREADADAAEYVALLAEFRADEQVEDDLAHADPLAWDPPQPLAGCDCDACRRAAA